MAKSRKAKPSFDAPAAPAGTPKSDTGWVYRSEAPAVAGRAAPSPPAAAVTNMAARPPSSTPAAAAVTAVPAPPASRTSEDASAVRRRKRHARAWQVVDRHALYAAAAGLVPVPVIDVAAIAGVQVAMVRSLAKAYEIQFNRERSKAIVTALIGGVVPTAAGRGVLKVLAMAVPIAGTVFSLTTVSAFASMVTHAVGHRFITHFESGGTIDDIDVDASRRHIAKEIATI